MLTQDGNHLIVLEDMHEDWSLPKFKKGRWTSDDITRKGGSQNDVDLTDEDGEESFNDPRRRNVIVNFRNGEFGSTIRLVPVEPRQSFWSKFAFWHKRKEEQPLAAPEMSIEEFFSSLKNNQQELNVIRERATGYERAMLNAQQAGQQALLEQLKQGLNAYRMETQLIALGMTKFLAEETVVGFCKQSKKGLRLDYVRNFVRTIPSELVAKKTRADELGIFDNYVVLHYDPEAKSYAETQREKEAKKDPILFGLMKGRRILYVVGDWIDELCDLTLDQIAEELGKDAVGSLDDLSKQHYR